MRRLLVLLSTLAALSLGAACKDKPKQAATTGSGSAVATGSGSATDSAGSAGEKPNEITLPPLTGTPPVKTTKPLDKAKSDEITKSLDFNGFSKDVRRADDAGLDVRYKTVARPRLAITINAGKCFDCLPTDVEKWKPKTDGLKGLIGPELKDRPDSTFELGTTDVGGTPVIFTYHVGYSIPANPTEELPGAYAHAYALYFNDGVNMIRVVAEYKDDVPKTREDMVNLAPREDLEKLAKAFFDAYVHAWG